jgi:tetratricopeptide (TPR) repeat protein
MRGVILWEANVMAEFTPHEAAAHDALSLPVAAPTKLIGRDVTLGRIYSQLRELKPVLLYGLEGMGKTALAATLASAYSSAPELKGGVLYLNIKDDTLSELIVRIGRAYKHAEISSTENPLNVIPAVTTLLNSEKPLIVLDGRLNAQATSEFITRCAKNLPVLLVNEEEIAGNWTAQRLGKLEPQHAMLMFKQTAEISTGMLDAEVNDLINAFNFTPFALAIAAGWIRANKQSPAAFLASMPPQPPGTQVNSAILALTAAFRSLSKAANGALQGLLMVIGATFTGSASAELISMVAGAPVETINNALSLLAQRNMVERVYRYGEPYYHLHSITHSFLQTWLRGTNQLDALQTKVRDAALAYARKYGELARGGSEETVFNRLAMEMDLLLAAAQWSADSNDRETANQLAAALLQAGNFVSERGYMYELLLLRRLAASSTTPFPAHAAAAPSVPAVLIDAEADEAEEDLEEVDEDEEDFFEDGILDEFDEDLDDDEVEDEDEDLFDEDDEDKYLDGPDDDELDEDEELLVNVSPSPLPLPFDETPLQKPITSAVKPTGDRRQQAEQLTVLGKTQSEEKRDNEAIATYSQALTLYEALNDTPGILATLEALAELTVRTENSQAAVLHASRGITLAREYGSTPSLINLLTLLGDARQQLGESDDAIRAYSEGLELARLEKDEQQDAVISYKLAYAQLDSGDPEEAIKTWEVALQQFKAQNRRNYEGKTLGGLGTAFAELERWSEAINYHTSALHIAREVGDKDEEALELTNIAFASTQANQLGEAVKRYRQALHLAYQANDKRGIVSTTVDLARLLVESPRHLPIAELLVDGALETDAHDRDLIRLKERIEDEREALGDELDPKPIGGTARDYAANAYALLE